MPSPDDNLNDPPKKKNPTAEQLAAERDSLAAERDKLAAELLRRDAEAARAKEREKALAEERAKAIANKEPPKLIGTISVYLQDEPADIIARARPLFVGQIATDRATRFRTEDLVTLGKSWPLAKRLKTTTPPRGTEFEADEIPMQDRVAWAANSAIVAIA